MTNSFSSGLALLPLAPTSALQWQGFFLHGKTHDPPVHLLVLYLLVQPSVSILSFCVCPQSHFIIKWQDYSLYIQPAQWWWLQWTTHMEVHYSPVSHCCEGVCLCQTRTQHLTLIRFLQVGKLQFYGKFPPMVLSIRHLFCVSAPARRSAHKQRDKKSGKEAARERAGGSCDCNKNEWGAGETWRLG